MPPREQRGEPQQADQSPTQNAENPASLEIASYCSSVRPTADIARAATVRRINHLPRRSGQSVPSGVPEASIAMARHQQEGTASSIIGRWSAERPVSFGDYARQS